jgi:hypothetical protein
MLLQLGTKHDTRTAHRPRLFVSARRLQVANAKTVQSSSPGEYVGFGDMVIFPTTFNNSYWMIQPMTSFRQYKLIRNVSIFFEFPGSNTADTLLVTVYTSQCPQVTSSLASWTSIILILGEQKSLCSTCYYRQLYALITEVTENFENYLYVSMCI